MREVFRVVILPLILMGGILGIFYLLFGRRIKDRQDPKGIRSHATFGGFDPESDELSTAGQALTGKMHGQLRNAGLDVNTVEPADYGWTLEVGADGHAFSVRIGYLGEENRTWLLYLDPMVVGRAMLEDSAGLRRVLTACHESLERMGASALTWHKREDHASGHHDRGEPRPL